MDIDPAALRALERERDISLDVLVPAIEQALVLAYHRTDGAFRHARAELDRLRIVETTAQAFVDALATSLAGAPWPSATPKPPPGPATCSSSAPTATSSRARSGD